MLALTLPNYRSSLMRGPSALPGSRVRTERRGFANNSMSDASAGWGGSNAATKELGFRHGLENALHRRPTTAPLDRKPTSALRSRRLSRAMGIHNRRRGNGVEIIIEDRIGSNGRRFSRGVGCGGRRHVWSVWQHDRMLGPERRCEGSYVQAGGKYTVEREGKTIQGARIDTGNQICYAEFDPAPPAGTKPICTSSALTKVGATWSVTEAGVNVDQCVLKKGQPVERSTGISISWTSRRIAARSPTLSNITAVRLVPQRR